LKIPPKKEKNQNKISMDKAMRPSVIHMPLLDSPGPESMYRLNPSLIDPGGLLTAIHI
jgi:hypothetical protein